MGGKPVLYYSLRAFEDSRQIDEIILVCGAGEEEYCRQEIVEKYGFSKVCKIISGGAERYNSVWNGLQETKDGYVYIHDGAVRQVRNGADIYCTLPILSVFLGHKKLSDTETYVRLTQEMYPDVLKLESSITSFLYPALPNNPVAYER